MYINGRDIFEIVPYIHLSNTHPQFQFCSISRFWSILGSFAFSVFLFCHLIGGRDSPKKRKIHEECDHAPRFPVCLATSLGGGWRCQRLEW